MDANPELQRTHRNLTRELVELKRQRAAIDDDIKFKETALELIKDHAEVVETAPAKQPEAKS